MNAQGLAEIGCWAAAHGQTLIYGQKPQSMDAAKTYWTASKCRLQRWTSALRMFGDDLEVDPSEPNYHDPWPAMQIVIQEILISELLTRIWSAVLVTHDQQTESDELGGLAHSVFIGHLEAKNRAIRLMLTGRAANEEAFDRLNKLRHRLERWTDLFLAQLPKCDSSMGFAFDPTRVNDFRNENTSYTTQETMVRQQIHSASMMADISDLADCFPANPELNNKIATGVIACFPSDRFDSSGLPKSARMLWVEKSQLDTEYFMDKLIDFENQTDKFSISQFSRGGWN